MEAQNETTKYFVNKTGDKMLIEIEITGNPDDVIKKLAISLNQDISIFDGAKVSQMYFNGMSIDRAINEKAKQLVKNNLENFIKELDA